MESKEKTLLVIYPSKGQDTGFGLFVAETGEGIASHFCSHEGFAKGDLYDNRPDRKEEIKEKFGDVEVKFLDQTELSVEKLTIRNEQWYLANNPKKEEE